METLNRVKTTAKRFVPTFLISWYHFLLSFLGAAFYVFPSKNLKIIGVTGTNGKSTVVEMISQILEEAGSKVASFSSIRFKIAGEEKENILKMTMPGRFMLQGLLRQAKNAGCEYVILEVTSEGIKQHRHRFIDFETAVFTNLTPEHIEAHGSFEKYRQAKEKLFLVANKIHVLNLDDENVKHFLKFPAEKKYGYGLNLNSGAQDQDLKLIKAKNYQISEQGLNFSVDDTEFNLKLLGKFNIYNALAAICVGLSRGVDLATCSKALERMAVVPGRMEMVISKPFKVLVDYAFTPNALKKVYQTIRDNFNPNELICVLGAAGGGRDKWKRPVLGKLAGKYCNQVFVTDEDPYDEDPMEIIDQVSDGVGSKATKILDRREAIGESLRSAKTGDVVVITGKGCEPWICVANDKKIAWDDRRIAREEFEKLKQ